ncbi:MAG: response regulator [Magnetospirillum sp. WYHS-4]
MNKNKIATNHLRAYDLSRVRFLVVDPNPHMRKLYKEIFRAWGVAIVDEADSADSGLPLFREFRHDIIITEKLISPTDGIALVKTIRRHVDEACRVVPIIMATSCTEERFVVGARDSGVTEFLAKPITVKGIYDRICAIVEDERPFLVSRGYCGPCRRRHKKHDYAGPFLRVDDWLKICRQAVDEAGAMAMEAEAIASENSSAIIVGHVKLSTQAAEQAKAALMAAESSKTVKAVKVQIELAEKARQDAASARDAALAAQAALEIAAPPPPAKTEDEATALSQERVATMLKKQSGRDGG